MRKTQADIQQDINNKRQSYNMQKIYCNHYKNNKIYTSGGIQYMSPDNWAKVGIISEVPPDDLYAACIRELNWASVVMSTEWPEVQDAITCNANAHRQIKMNPLVGNPSEQAELNPHDPSVQAAIALNFFDDALDPASGSILPAIPKRMPLGVSVRK
jgi:hypothetical protein